MMANTLLLVMMIISSFQVVRSAAFSNSKYPLARATSSGWTSVIARRLSSSSKSSTDPVESASKRDNKQWGEEAILTPPWSRDVLSQKGPKRSSNRFRQHVNPLARKFQQQTILSDNWPRDVYEDCKVKPLFLDIGVSKGGFLLSVASQKPQDYNYLGLEIRPLAVQFAQERLRNNPEFQIPCKGHLDFVGCNANVDLGRLLSKYQEASNETPLDMVTIQFPDPHFKSSHAKRRVVTPELVNTLPSFMPPGAKVFLQSDVQSVLDGMRERFREAPTFFQDQVEDMTLYYPENIIGIATEREVSVLKQDLPVYRALFVRTDAPAL